MPALTRILFGALLVLGPYGTFLSADPLAAAEAHRCHIGKPSYCFKYGGARCAKTNPRGAEGCARWREACVACHAAIPACLGDGPVKSAAPKCGACSQAWSQCMHRADAKSWPSRGQK